MILCLLGLKSGSNNSGSKWTNAATNTATNTARDAVKQQETMMTLCISVLGYHAAVFSSTQAMQFKSKFLPMEKPSNNIVLLNDVYKRGANIKKIENVLVQPSSFMIVGETNSDHKSYFFFTEPFNGLHRLDAYIVDEIDDLSNLKTWHDKYFSNYVLQLF